jgi:hypothetical protein
MSKLTLNIDPEIIEAAKAYSQQQGISLSRLVSGYLSELVENLEDEFIANLHKELKQEGYQSPRTDTDVLRQHHIVDKYL